MPACNSDDLCRERCMKMPPNEQAGREIFPDTEFLNSSKLKKASELAKKDRQDVMNNFLLYGFCSLDAFHQPDLFSNSLKRVIRELLDSLAVTCKGPSKEIDKKFLRMKGTSELR
jgi:hypothetical protein